MYVLINKNVGHNRTGKRKCPRAHCHGKLSSSELNTQTVAQYQTLGNKTRGNLNWGGTGR